MYFDLIECYGSLRITELFPDLKFDILYFFDNMYEDGIRRKEEMFW